MSTKPALDWVRKIQAEVGLADAPDPRPEMLSRLKAYPQLIEDKRRLMEALTYVLADIDARRIEKLISDETPNEARAVALLAELETR